MHKLALLSALSLCASAASAADNVGHWYVTPEIGGLYTDDDRNIEGQDWLYGLVLGRHLSQALSLELTLNGSQVGGSPIDLNAYGASIDLLRVFARDSAVSPYISVGAGVVRDDPSPIGAHSDDAMAQAGVGALLRVWESSTGSSSFSLRPDLKARYQDSGNPDHYLDYIATLGFQFSFGPPSAAAPAPQPVAAPPAPEPAPAPPPPPPPPPPPQDSDHDGVTDNIDQCPGTPRGVAVDAVGCPRKGAITLEGVTFEYDSARLTAASRPVLDEVATGLKEHPRLKVELQGHTDSIGSDQYNLRLSERRAQAVRDYLLMQGVAAAQMVARGYGESQPLADNKTEEGRSKNRRVAMFVVDNPGEVEVKGEGSVEDTTPK